MNVEEAAADGCDCDEDSKEKKKSDSAQTGTRHAGNICICMYIYKARHMAVAYIG